MPLFPIMEKVFNITKSSFATFMDKDILQANVEAGRGVEVKTITNLYNKMVDKRL